MINLDGKKAQFFKFLVLGFVLVLLFFVVYQKLFLKVSDDIPSEYSYLVSPWIDMQPCRILNSVNVETHQFPWSFCELNQHGMYVYDSSEIIFFSQNGDKLWSEPLLAHHDLDVHSSGEKIIIPIKSFTQENSKKIKLDSIYIFSKSGEVESQWTSNHSLNDLQKTFNKPIELYEVKEEGHFEWTYINAASFIPPNTLSEETEFLKPNNILVSFNGLGLGVFDSSLKKILWTYPTELLGSGQIHSARVLKNGHILVYVNTVSPKFPYSKIIELNPLSKETVWEYSSSSPSEFSHFRFGSVFRSDDETTIVTHVTSGGQAFEVNALGEVVWTWDNPKLDENQLPRPIYRVKKIENSMIPQNAFFDQFRVFNESQ